MSDTKTKDRYDRAIDELMRYADDPALFNNKVTYAWKSQRHDDGEYYPGPLFLYVTPTGTNEDGRHCGCLTQVAIGFDAWTDELAEAIKADDRIPHSVDSIQPYDLPVFAEWQRKLDAMFPGRNPEEASCPT